MTDRCCTTKSSNFDNFRLYCSGHQDVNICSLQVLPVSLFSLYFCCPFDIILKYKFFSIYSCLLPKRLTGYSGKWNTGKICNVDSQNICSVQIVLFALFAYCKQNPLTGFREKKSHSFYMKKEELEC